MSRNGERRFTRYGYADLYQEGRGFDILYRLWPGTQRHLLSADPAWRRRWDAPRISATPAGWKSASR